MYTESEPTIGFDFTGIETAHVSHRPLMVSLISPWGLSTSLSFCEPYSGGPFILTPHLKTKNQYTPQLTKLGSIYIPVYKLHLYHYTYSEWIKEIAELSFHLLNCKKVVKIEKTLSNQKPHLLLRSQYVWHWFYSNIWMLCWLPLKREAYQCMTVREYMMFMNPQSIKNY